MSKNTFRHHVFFHSSLQKRNLQCPLIASLLGLDIKMRGVRVPKEMRSGHGDQNSKKIIKKGLRHQKKVGPLKT